MYNTRLFLLSGKVYKIQFRKRYDENKGYLKSLLHKYDSVLFVIWYCLRLHIQNSQNTEFDTDFDILL